MFRCPYCGKKLVMLNEWKRYETILEHGFNPNGTVTKKPCYICPDGCHSGYYGIFGGYYNYDVITGLPNYHSENTLPPIGSVDWENKFNSTWDISESRLTKDVNKSFKDFMRYIDNIINLYISIRNLAYELKKIDKYNKVMNDCDIPYYKELWYRLKDWLGVGYKW